MQFKRNNRANYNYGTGIGVGIILSCALSVILSMAVTVLVLNERVGENTIGYIIQIVVLFSSLLGSTVAGKMIRERIAIVTGITGIVYMLILVGTGILCLSIRKCIKRASKSA